MESSEAEQYRTALSVLLAHDTFVRSQALGRLLTYLVESVLAGEASTLKESVIGHEFYGRPAGYDPKLDSLVRVSANRLRTRLDEHYRANPGERVRIVLPKGSYVPQLEILLEVPGPPLETATDSASQGAVFVPPVDIDAVAPPGRGALSSRTAQVALLVLSLGLIFLCMLFWKHTRHPAEVAADQDWSVRPFARLGGSQQFGSFSPDGSLIAFTSATTHFDNKAIYIQATNSEEARQITTGVRPAWSPDGKRLAFLRPERDERRWVILYDLATGTETKLTELVGVTPWLCQVPRLSWSHDGRVLYSSASTGSNTVCGIVAIDVASHQVRPLLPPGSRVGDLEPTVSPDGSTIAFMRDLAIGSCDLFLVSTRGGEPRRITHDTADIVGFDWTPDGKALVVASSENSEARILWRVPVAGGVHVALTDGSSAPTFPSVSSQGNLINFTQFHVRAPIWKAADGKTVEVLDNQSRNGVPMISPDGKRLLYGSDRSGKWDMWLSHADGSDSRPLLRNGAYELGTAQWSPDGRQILLECNHARKPHICVSDAEGNGVHQITSENIGQVNPSWSRDGRSVYFASSPTGRDEMYRMNLAGGAPVLVTHGGGSRALESWDGQWLFVVRSGPTSRIVALPMKETQGQPLAEHTVVILPEMHDNTGFGWDTCKDGLVYVAEGGGPAPRLDVFDMQTRTSRPFLALGEPAVGADLSIRVLPDGHGVVFTAASTYSELSMMSLRK